MSLQESENLTSPFRVQLLKFEEVVAQGVVKEIIGKSAQVNVREGRFAKTDFARFMGSTIDSDHPFVIDYYGHLKKSRGFLSLVEGKSAQIRNRQLKSMATIVVFFASLKIEDIASITSDPTLRGTYVDFKQIILQRRGFGKKKIVEEFDVSREDRSHVR